MTAFILIFNNFIVLNELVFLADSLQGECMLVGRSHLTQRIESVSFVPIKSAAERFLEV